MRFPINTLIFRLSAVKSSGYIAHLSLKQHQRRQKFSAHHRWMVTGHTPCREKATFDGAENACRLTRKRVAAEALFSGNQ
ncbi:hypothetical protein Dda3937_03756 [Dickeya dadantii 3937]|uniref:Uncharacterized protein n=1 Tax=Dickeya dadantii (strain 3937) TaxID=198628 RepID=E0SK99_DICD3|nr:hypothetical protein Dda3937_03756 [Dickeya dadantii 3937]